jgi:hypothetical protein
LCKPCHRIAGMEVAPKLTLRRAPFFTSGAQ